MANFPDRSLRHNSVSTHRDPKTGEWIIDGRSSQPQRFNCVEAYRDPKTGEWLIKQVSPDKPSSGKFGNL